MELDYLKKWTLYSPERTAISDPDRKLKFTYAEFFQWAQAFAYVLSNRFNIKPGDRIGVISQNELEYVILFYAAQRLGAILVPFNQRLAAPELSYLIKDCQPKVIFYQHEFFEKLNLSLAQMGSVTECFSLNEGNCLASLGKEFFGKSFEFLGHAEAPCMIIYTSGTTGFPKGAVITPKMIFWNSINTGLRLNLTQKDKAVIFLPFFHTGAWNVLTTPFIHHGAELIFLKKFDADKILEISARESCSLLFGVPTTMDMMASSAKFSSYDLSKLRYAIVGGEPMSVESIKIWHQKGVAIRQGYGLTEFGPNVFSLNEEDAIRKIGSIGFPNFYIEAKIVGESGQTLNVNQVGELALKGPVQMLSYWNNPNATEETIRDGWLYTGDLVRQDEEGYYYVVGRKKDMYKSGGENVYPAEIEQVLRSYPGIKESAVIGVPDNKWGEVGHAFLALTEEKFDQSSVIQYCQQRLAKFKIPRYFTLLESLPKGDSGKILKRNLLDQAKALL